MKARLYLNSIVRPNVADFLQNPADMRLAFNAAISLYHVADYAAVELGQRPATMIGLFEAACYGFGVAGDIANAAKHSHLDRKARAGTDVSHIAHGSAAAFSDGSFFSDGSSFDDAPTVGCFDKSGKPFDLTHLLPDVLAAIEPLLP